MKILLSLSLILNVVLISLLIREWRQPPLERIVLENHLQTNKDQHATRVGPLSQTNVALERKADSSSIKLPDAQGNMQKVVEETFEKVTQDRLQFLTEVLNLNQSDLDEIEKVKESYYRKLEVITTYAQGHELSIDQKRRMLDLEVERDKEFEKLLGKTKWKQFQKFKTKYNAKKFQDREGDNSVVVPLDI